MKSNYEPLGKHIQLVDYRNSEEVTSTVLGISIDKEFMPSVANVIGTDLSRYKLISKGLFACNPMHVGRDERLPIALYEKDSPAIVSPAYFMFEIIDRDVLNEEYLMMWFRRLEFDRECWFMTDGSVRGGITWDDLCRIKLPVPSYARQCEIVESYRTVTERIALKRAENDNLAKTIKAVFKSWFLDFDAFDGVELVQSQYGLIPNGWHYELLGNLCDCVTKGTTPTTLGKDFTDTGINFIKGESINDDHSFNKTLFAHIDDKTDELLKRSRIYVNDIVFTIAGTLGKFALVDSSVVPANTNQAVAIIRTSKIMPAMLYSYFIGEWQVEFYKRNTQQAVQANLSLGTIKDLPILLPDSKGQDHYMQLVTPLIVGMQNNFSEIERLYELQNQLLARLSSSR